MIITSVNTGEKASYSVQGTVVAVGEVTIDLATRQGDTEKVIDICLDNQLQSMREGMGAWYVANIIIPPLQREVVPSGEKDEEGNDVMIEEVRPLDMSKVELRLWRLPAEYGQTTTETTETTETTNEGVTE